MAGVAYYSFHGAFGSDLFDVSTAHRIGNIYNNNSYTLADNYGNRLIISTGNDGSLSIQFASYLLGDQGWIWQDFVAIGSITNNVINSAASLWDLFIKDGVAGAMKIVLEGSDSFVGSKVGDILEGYAGNDVILGKGGDDTIYGGVGDDNLWFGPSGNGVMSGGEGTDFFFVHGDDGNGNVTPTSVRITDLGLGGADILQVGLVFST